MDNQTIVLVLGQTGVGKSTFINGIANLYGKHVVTSSGLNSCTQEIAEICISIDGTNVCLIDTPGFDDTNKTNDDILDIIYKWLTDKNKTISLVLHVQRITDIRMGGMSLKTVSMMEKICNKDMKCLHFVTSMWDIPGNNGDEREMELVTNYWKLALHKGSGFARLGSVSHNLSLLRRLLQNSGQLTELPDVRGLAISDGLEASMKKVHEAEMSNMRKIHENEIHNTKKVCEDKVSNIERVHRGEMGNMERAHNSNIYNMRETYEGKISNLTRTHENKVSDTKREHERKVSGMKREHENKVSEMKREHESKISNMRRDYDNRISNMEERHDDNIRRQKRIYNEEVSNLGRQYNAQIQNMRAEYEQKIRDGECSIM